MTTIYALSSGAGRAGVAVIRLSGPATGQVVRGIAGGLPPPRQASLRRLRDASGATLDRGLVLWFPSPRSFTGEDCAEFHVHGSRAVVAALLDEVGRTAGCRPAQPGEFARRAFLNGKSDLIALEALADLLSADTEAQRRMAVRQDGSGLRGKVEGWVDRLSRLLADIEADLDFSDEDDVNVDSTASRAAGVVLANEMRQAMQDAARSDAMRKGFVVAIVGPPNAGKSSLLNRLAGHEAAIVSDIPGTTRDTIEIRLDLGGLPVRVIDTAGLRQTQDSIERIGVARALEAAYRADLNIWLSIDAAPPDDLPVGLAVASQRDRFGNDPLPSWAGIGLSIHSEASVAALLDVVRLRAETCLDVDAEMIVSDRQRRLISSAAGHCERLGDVGTPELIAEVLRQARRDLALVTGRAAASDVLDVVFSRFCIGK